MDEVSLGATESALVGDVVGGVSGFRVLTVDTSDLDVVLVGDGLELVPLLGELGESDVDGSSEGGAEVGGAGSDVSEVTVVGELGDLLDLSGSAGKSVEDGVDVSTWLHGDDTELIFFVNPDEEGLGIVVEDTSALGPLAVEVAGLQESVSLPIFNIILYLKRREKRAGGTSLLKYINKPFHQMTPLHDTSRAC